MITTFQQHILQQQREVPYASGDFSWLLSGITLAAKMIEAKIRCAGLCNILGTAGQTNVQGETQQKLDVYANEALLHCLGVRDSVATLISEENDEPVTFGREPDTGKYVIVFDPLDGSSNIDVNVNVGTIFSIYQTQRRLFTSRCRIRLAAWELSTCGRLRPLWPLDCPRVHRGPRSLRVYARSDDWSLCLEPRTDENAGEGQILFV